MTRSQQASPVKVSRRSGNGPPPPLRIAHVITRLILGGAQENTVATAIGLQARPEWTVDLVAGPPEESENAEGSIRPRVRQHAVPLTILSHLIRPVHPVRDILAGLQLVRHFRRTRPDIVHTHSGKAGILGRLAARRARVPLIIHTVHGPSFGPFQGPLPNVVFRTAERIAGQITDHFVSVADALTAQYLAAHIGRPAQFTTIRSGFDLEPFLGAQRDPAIAAQWGLRDDDFVIGKIARFAPLKGHEELIPMFLTLVRQCPRAKLLLVGDGPHRRAVEQAVARAGLADRVRFTGLVAPETIPACLGLIDVLVHLSYREGLPRALPQALAAGRPVVAYDCDGAREVCLDGKTGFLVPPGQTQLAAERLLQLSRDAALRATLGARGKELVRDHFSVGRMVEDLHTLYLHLWNSGGRGDRRPDNRRNPS